MSSPMMREVKTQIPVAFSQRLRTRIMNQIKDSDFSDKLIIKSVAAALKVASSQPTTPEKTIKRQRSVRQSLHLVAQGGETTPLRIKEMMPDIKPLQLGWETARTTTASNTNDKICQFKRVKMRGQVNSSSRPSTQATFRIHALQTDFDIENPESQKSEEGEQADKTHQFVLKSMKCSRNEIKTGLELNHIISNRMSKKQNTDPQVTKLSKLIDISLKHLEQKLFRSPDQTDQQVMECMTQFGQMISLVMTNLNQMGDEYQNPWMSYCERSWQIIVFLFDTQIQNLEKERKHVETNYVDTLQKEINHKTQQNVKLLNELVQLHDDFVKSQKQANMQITLLQGQIHLLKTEYQEYRVSQNELAQLDNASEAMKIIGSTLKQSSQLIKNMEEHLMEREKFLQNSMGSIVEHYRQHRSEMFDL